MATSMMRWFRRNQKFFLAGLAIVLMMAWLMAGSLRRLVGRAARTAGKIRGETITGVDRNNARVRLEALQTPRFLGRSGKPRGLIDGTGVLGEFVFQPKDQAAAAGPQPITNEAVWRWLILVKEAEAAGIQVTAEEARLPEDADIGLRSAAADFIRVQKLLDFKFGSVDASRPELWQDYLYQEEAVKLRFVALRAADFRPLVELSEQEMKDLYEQYREQNPDPDSGTPGYMAPERVRLEYAVAPLVDFDKNITVSPEEIEQYYTEHKEDYRIPEGKEGDSGTGAGAGEEVRPESPDAGDEPPPPPPPPPPRYKPLEEVREQIRKTLHARKVREAAEGAAREALEFLDGVQETYTNEPLPLRVAALRNGMTYAKPTLEGGLDLLSKEEIERVVPDGSRVARAVFGEGALQNFVMTVPGAAGGPMLVQVLERREPEPRPYEEVRGRVREDLTVRKTLEAAQKVADKLILKAKASSLAEAVDETNRRLDSLLRRNLRHRGSGARGQGPADGRLPPADSVPIENRKIENPLPLPPLLKVEETGFFSRSGLTAEVPRRAARQGFRIGPKEFARVVERGKDPACYVIQEVEDRPADPARFYEWLRASQFQLTGYSLAVVSTRDKLRQEKARRVVRDWLAGLAEANPMPEEPEQKK